MTLLQSMTIDEFTKMLAKLLQVDAASLTPETNLVLDVGLDSLKLLEIILEFEKMGVPVNLKDAWGIQTVSEAYEYYRHTYAPQDERTIQG